MRLPDPWRRPLLTIEEAGSCLGMGRATAYRAVDRGELPTLAMCGGRRVPTAALWDLLGLPVPPQPTSGRPAVSAR